MENNPRADWITANDEKRKREKEDEVIELYFISHVYQSVYYNSFIDQFVVQE